MTNLCLKICGNWKRFPILLALTLSTLARGADEIRVALLAAGGKNYTNAVITRVTPAYAVVSYQEGMAQIPMSNMPAAYQSQFGYTPEKARQFLDEEKEIQKNRRAAALAQRAALQAAAGSNRLVRITTIDDNPTYGGFPFCSVEGIKGGILIENFPDSVRQFMAGYRQLEAEITDCQRQVDNLKVLATSPAEPVKPQMGKTLMVGNGAGFVRASSPKRDDVAAARRNAEDRLKALNARLEQATTNYNLYTTIVAHPSGRAYVGKPIWICVGIPPAAIR